MSRSGKQGCSAGGVADAAQQATRLSERMERQVIGRKEIGKGSESRKENAKIHFTFDRKLRSGTDYQAEHVA